MGTRCCGTTVQLCQNNPILRPDPSGYRPRDPASGTGYSWREQSLSSGTDGGIRTALLVIRMSTQYRVVELRPGCITMGGFEGFSLTTGANSLGFVRTSVAGSIAAFLLRFGARGFRYPGPDVPSIVMILWRDTRGLGRESRCAFPWHCAGRSSHRARHKNYWAEREDRLCHLLWESPGGNG